jgi:uncharacterized protein YkwD
MLLIAVGLPHTAPQRQLIAQSAAISELPVSAPVSAPTPRVIPVATATPLPSIAATAAATPKPRPRVVAAIRPAKPRAQPTAAPARPGPAGPVTVASGATEFALINQDRRAAGLPPLQWNACLANVAVGQATRMATANYMSHAGGKTIDLGCHLDGSWTGENIGMQGGSIDDVWMNNWFMNDAPHRANILGIHYHYVAAAWVWSASHTAYLAVEFG